MKRSLIAFLVTIFTLTLVSCNPSPREQFDEAIANGELSVALKLLPQIERNEGFYHCCTMLIDDYLAIDHIDKAIYVFDKVSRHYPMHRIRSCTDSVASYTKENAQKIYKKLIVSNRFDEAWTYHPLSYDTEDYPGNAPDYFAYIVDVITFLCSNNRKAEAQIFLNTHINWFSKNVDNHEWGKEYPQFAKNKMHSQLHDILMAF